MQHRGVQASAIRPGSGASFGIVPSYRSRRSRGRILEQAKLALELARLNAVRRGGSARKVPIYFVHCIYNCARLFIWNHVGTIGDDKPLASCGEMLRQLNLTIHPSLA